MIDGIARTLGRDPLDVRRTNFYGGPGRDTTPYGQVVADNVLHALVDELEASSDYRARRNAVAAFNAASPVLRRGLALTPVKFGISFNLTHFNQAGALVHVYIDGSVRVNHGGTEMGQGLHTKVCQVVAAELGIPLERVRATATDTSKVANTSATAASTGADLNGQAAAAAARTIRTRLAAFATRRFGEDGHGEDTGAARAHGPAADPAAVHFADGRVRVGTRTIPFAELVAEAYRARASAVVRRLLCHARAALGDAATLTGHPSPLLRLGCGGVRGGGQHAHRRMAPAARRSAARRRQLAQPGDRPRPGRGRLHPGHGLAHHGGAVVERRRPVGMTHAPSTYKIPAAHDCPPDLRVRLLDDPHACGHHPATPRRWASRRCCWASRSSSRCAMPSPPPATAEPTRPCARPRRPRPSSTRSTRYAGPPTPERLTPPCPPGSPPSRVCSTPQALRSWSRSPPAVARYRGRRARIWW